MTAENGSTPIKDILDTKVSRRGLFRMAAGAALGATALGRALGNPDATKAASDSTEEIENEPHDINTLLDGGADLPPTPRPETRDPYVQMIDATTLSIDPELPDDPERKLLRIVGLSTNPYQAEFAELNPNNPYDRLDRLFVELGRGLQPRREEIKSIPDRLLSDAEFKAQPMTIKANAQEVPDMLTPEEYIKKMEDHPNLNIWLWAYNKDGKLSLTTMEAAKGWDISIIKGPPKVAFNKDNSGNIRMGYTHEVIDHKLKLGIYLADIDPNGSAANPDDGIYTPTYWVDWKYSNALALAVQDLILYGGNTQMHDGLDVKYLSKTNTLPNAALIPEVAELACGGLRYLEAYDQNQYDSAPALHVQSPDIEPDMRYR